LLIGRHLFALPQQRLGFDVLFDEGLEQLPVPGLAGIWIEVARLRAAIQVLQHLFVAAPSE